MKVKVEAGALPLPDGSELDYEVEYHEVTLAGKPMWAVTGLTGRLNAKAVKLDGEEFGPFKAILCKCEHRKGSGLVATFMVCREGFDVVWRKCLGPNGPLPYEPDVDFEQATPYRHVRGFDLLWAPGAR